MNYVLHKNKIRKNINPKNFLRNTKQEFPCQSLESLSGVGEYYNMKNKILDFKMKQKSSTTTDGVHKNGATVKNVKRWPPVKNAYAVRKFRQLSIYNNQLLPPKASWDVKLPTVSRMKLPATTRSVQKETVL